MVQQKILKLLDVCGKSRNNHKKCITVFQDLDGCLCYHRYDNFKKDLNTIFIPAIKKLLEMKEKGFYIVLTTGRQKKDCKYILKYLKDYFDFKFDDFIFNLPTGKRVLINDFTDEYKAKAYNTVRNLGMADIDINDF